LGQAKICIHCNLEKPIDEFPKYKNRYGESFLRNVCRICFNKQTKKTPSDKIYTPRIRTETNAEYRVERNIYNMLSNEQIESLIILAEKKDELLNLLNKNKKIEVCLDDNKANRTVRAINLDNKIYDFIKERGKKANLSYSDIINSMLRKAMEYMD